MTIADAAPETAPASLWRFDGAPADFWAAFLAAAASAAAASAALLMIRNRKEGGEWRKLAPWPSAEAARRLAEVNEHHANEAVLNGSACRSLLRQPGDEEAGQVLLLRLPTLDAAEDSVAAFLTRRMDETRQREALARLADLAPAPMVYQERRQLLSARGDLARFSSVLDLLTVVSGGKKFLPMAMTLCNEIAARHQCEKVSLGWADEDGYVRLRAISHTESFERKMDAVRRLEAAMEEALDQDDEVVWPAPACEAALIVRDHEACAASRSVKHLCTIPIRQGGKPVGAITCERQSVPFDDIDLRRLRLACDLTGPRLDDLHRRDRWIGARAALAIRERLASLLGPRHTWAKAAGLATAIILGVMVFGRMPHRVEGTFILRAEDGVLISAGQDGFIHQVLAVVGDKVAPGQVLLRLDNRELLLEEASAAADHHRYVREAEKARAEQQLADMQIALALGEQAKARLDLVRHRLERCAIRAPLEGVVVEGDLRERIGSSVRQGDPLFRVAGLSRLYVLAEVEESQVHEIQPGLPGRMAFISQPALKFPFRVVRVDPVAVALEGGNFFQVRCESSGPAADWWRPGMSGVAKIEAGRRSPLWIATRRTVDFFRLRFWW